MIPEQFIQELLNRIDVVDVVDKSVPLKKTGANYSACCPFHNEKSPSFTVSSTKQFYHCFGCGAHGTAISFLMEYSGLSFVESIHELAKQVGMVVPQETPDANKLPKKVAIGLQEYLQQAASYYKAELKKSTYAIDYLKSRGLSGQTAAKFQIGYAPAKWQNLQTVFANYDNEALLVAGLVAENDQGKRYDRFRDRIIFPIHNQKGEVIGFGGRAINPDDTPKYYNSPETPLFQKSHELYGFFIARRAIRNADRVLVVEGYMDVVALAQFGIDYAVATLGTATTLFHITKLMRQTDEIVFCFDGDNAGRTAAWRAAMNALSALTDGLHLRYLFLPQGHDPDSYVRDFGKEQLEKEMQNATPLSKYIIQHLCEKNPLNSQEDKVTLLNNAEPILREIKAPKFSLMLQKRIAELTGISEVEMQKLLKLNAPNKAPARLAQRKTYSPLSIKKRFILMALMLPSLVKEEDLIFFGDNSEDAAYKQILQACIANADYKPAALLHLLEQQVDIGLLNKISTALHRYEENEDLALEFSGARTQLSSISKQAHKAKQLNELKEKSLSELSEDERETLKSLTAKSVQNKA